MARHRARKSSPLYLPSAFELFKPSRDLVLDNLNIFGPLFAFTLLLWVHSWIWIPASGGHYWDRFVDANYSWPIPVSFLVALIGFSLLWLFVTVVGGFLIQ